MTLTLLFDECPKLSDGRVAHYIKKVGDEYVCANCGEVRAHPFQQPIEAQEANG